MIKLTKSELRKEQHRLQQLQKYLPTLQLKKVLLQLEVNGALQEIEQFQSEFKVFEKKVREFSALFSERNTADLFSSVKILEVQKRFENIAGVDIPILEKVVFPDMAYLLFDSPVWVDAAIISLRQTLELREKIRVAEDKKAALEKELQEVTIRVNLFEKILIPRSQGNIRKIRIFLGDQQLASICQAKVAKQKIVLRKKGAS